MSTTVVKTQYGKVQGTKSGPIFVWKGIPYATTFGLTSAQSGRMMQSFFTATQEPSGEDCLFLNIWSPGADDKRRPVLFWIHGGAFTMGSGSIPWYDGTAFASNGDVVVVTINYRLGALGFLHLRATRIAQKFMYNLGIHEVTDLEDAPLEQLLSVQDKVSGSGGGLAFQPFVDGVTLPYPPIQSIADGSANGVSLLVGTNCDEMRLFTMIDPAQATPDMAILERLFASKAKEVLAIYEAAHPEQSSSDAWIDFLTDRTFRISAIRLAERQSALGTNVWMYRFDWPTPVFNGLLKACHGLEIPFVWNNLDKYGVNILTGDDPARQKVANAMHPAWISFAHSSNPHTSVLPHWPAYDTTQRATMLFNEECQVVSDPQGTERQLWEGVL